MRYLGDMGGFAQPGAPLKAPIGYVPLFNQKDYLIATGSETTVRLTHIPAASLGHPLLIFKNGALLFYGVDYTVDANIITFGSAASTSDKFLIDYWATRQPGRSVLVVPGFTALGFDTAFQTLYTYSNTDVTHDTASNVNTAWYTGRTATSHADGTGKWQGEFVANAGGSDNYRMFGLLSSTATANNYMGAGVGACGAYQNSNAFYLEGVFSNPGTSGSSTTVPTQAALMAVDMTARKAWLYLSSISGFVGGGDPTTGSNPTFTWSSALTLHLATSLYVGASAKLNTGGGTFVCPLVSGYSLWG